MLEKKIKWLSSCLACLVFFLYIGSNFNDPNEEFSNRGVYHEQCECYRPIKEYPTELLDPKSLTCSEVSLKSTYIYQFGMHYAPETLKM